MTAGGAEPGYAVALDGVTVDLRVGFHAHERRAAQRVRIDVEVRRDAAPAAFAGVGDCMDYSRIRRHLMSVLPEMPHLDLLEQWADVVIASVAEIAEADEVRARLRKLDIYDPPLSATVTVTRRVRRS